MFPWHDSCKGIARSAWADALALAEWQVSWDAAEARARNLLAHDPNWRYLTAGWSSGDGRPPGMPFAAATAAYLATIPAAGTNQDKALRAVMSAADITVADPDYGRFSRLAKKWIPVGDQIHAVGMVGDQILVLDKALNSHLEWRQRDGSAGISYIIVTATGIAYLFIRKGQVNRSGFTEGPPIVSYTPAAVEIGGDGQGSIGWEWWIPVSVVDIALSGACVQSLDGRPLEPPPPFVLAAANISVLARMADGRG